MLNPDRSVALCHLADFKIVVNPVVELSLWRQILVGIFDDISLFIAKRLHSFLKSPLINLTEVQ